MSSLSSKGVAKPDTKGVHLADRVRARRALIAWIDALADGKQESLLEVAKRENIKPARMRRILAEDGELQKEVFAPLSSEAQMGVARACARGHEALSDDETKGSEARKWGEFFAKLAGGLYQRPEGAGDGGTNIGTLIANIQLPPGFGGAGGSDQAPPAEIADVVDMGSARVVEKEEEDDEDGED